MDPALDSSAAESAAGPYPAAEMQPRPSTTATSRGPENERGVAAAERIGVADCDSDLRLSWLVGNHIPATVGIRSREVPGRRSDLGAEGEHARDGLERARCTESVPCEGLDRAHGRTAAAEHGPGGGDLRAVVGWRPGS